MRDACNLEDGVKVFERVEASVVAEWALAAEFVEIDVALEDDLAGRGDVEIDSLAFDQIDRGSAKETGDEIFLDLGRGGNN